MRINPIKVSAATNIVGDIRSIMAYSHYLVMKAQLVGNFRTDGHKPADEETFVAEQCRSLCDRIVSSLSLCKGNHIPELIECYDIMCRLGYNRMPDKDIIECSKKRLFMAWKGGDRLIEESAVFGVAVSEVNFHGKNVGKGYAEAYRSIKNRWVATLVRHDYFPEATSYENYQRLALIMRENIDYELNAITTDCLEVTAGEMKHRWYKYNCVDNLSTLGTQILRSYRRFAGSLFPAVMDFDEKLELDNRILTELVTHPDLDPHDRKAFRLALAYNRQIAED